MMIFRKCLGYLKLELLMWCVTLMSLDCDFFNDASPSEFEEARLVNRLLDGYNKVVRPVRNYEDSVRLEIYLTVVQLVDMDEVNQIMTTSVWFNNTNVLPMRESLLRSATDRLKCQSLKTEISVVHFKTNTSEGLLKKWEDAFLTWNPDEFDNITSTTIDSSLIWLPDITLYNNANDDFANAILKTKATVSYDGTVQWDAPAVLESVCQLNPLYFPFDEQNCSIQLGSLTYSEKQLNISCPYEEGDTAYFQSSGEWLLISAPIVRYESHYPCCDEPDIHFYVILKRQPLFFLLNLIFPCVIISGLVLLGFYLPSDAGEKITLTITILVALNVFLLLVAETMPPTSEVVPLIGQYFILNIVLVGVCTATTVIILGIHHHGDSAKVPKWLHKLVLVKLSSALCLRNDISKLSNALEESGGNAQHARTPEMRQRARSQNVRQHELSTGVRQQFDGIDNAGVDNPVFEHDNGGVLITEADLVTSPSSESFASSDDPEHSCGLLEKYVLNMAKSVFGIGRLIRGKVDRKKQATEWMEVARVLDRLFMYLFGIAQILITVITLSLAAANRSV